MFRKVLEIRKPFLMIRVRAIHYCQKRHQGIPQKNLQTGLNVELTKFVRKPFTVEAVEITIDNIAEIATVVGTLRTKEDGSPYIQVNRQLVPNVFKVYPGFWMTKLGNNIRCYSGHIFTAQFIEISPNIEKLLEYINEESDTAVA